MKRNKTEKVVEILSMIASILMGMVTIYRSYRAIKENVKELVNRDESAGS